MSSPKDKDSIIYEPIVMKLITMFLHGFVEGVKYQKEKEEKGGA